MIHVPDPIRIHAERLAARIHVLELDDGPNLRGVAICGTPEAGHRGGPIRLSGTVHYAKDGRPRYAAFWGIPCEDPRDIDLPGLVGRIDASASCRYSEFHASEPWPAGGMPREARHLPHVPDMFAAIGWELDWDGLDLVQSCARDIDGAPGYSRWADWHAASMALCADRVAGALAAFRATLSPAGAGTLAFMRGTLPVFDPRVLDALFSDPDGRLRAFAVRYPLLAMRSLADPEVAGRARAGDSEGALRLSLRDDLVGCWVADHWRRHPKSADAVDGRRRGNQIDRAVDHFRHIPRGQLPMSPAGFAACVDVCGWAASMDPQVCDRNGPGTRAWLPRARGRWAETLADIGRVAPWMTGIPVGPARDRARSTAADVQTSFLGDLLMPALHVAGGGAGVQAADSALHARPDPHLAFRLLARGMGAPDMARACEAYRAARPAIAAADRRHAFDLRVEADLPDMPWVRVHQSETIPGAALSRVEVKPIRVETFVRSTWDYKFERSREPGTFGVSLPFPAPEGRVWIRFRVRRNGVGIHRDLVPTVAWEEEGLPPDLAALPYYRDVVRDMLGATGAADGAGLAELMVGLAGAAGRIAELDAAARPIQRARLGDVLAPWRRALPRRFRGLDVDAFSAAIAAEFRELGATADAGPAGP